MSKFLQFRNATGAGKNLELLVYGEIGDWGGEVKSRDFAEKLRAIDTDEIDVRINSNGGNVFTAQAIYSSLKRHPAHINVYIDGIAASAATIIAMAGDTIYMPENAMMMVHQPLVAVYGNADELRDMADILDKVRDTLVAVYRDKTGLDDDTIIQLMQDETYMTATDAKEWGFVDEVIPALKIAASRGKNGTIVINGLTIDADRVAKLPEVWRNAVESKHENPGVSGIDRLEEIITMTLDELKVNHPDLFKAAVEEGQKQERARIRAIEEMTMPGHEELAARAKFETGITPEAFAIEMVKAEKAVKDKYLANRQEDSKQVANVQPDYDAKANGDDDKRAAVISAMAKAFSAHNTRKV